MRNNVHQVIETWIKTMQTEIETGQRAIRGPSIQDDDLRRLERELLIVITSPTADERDQNVINNTIAGLRALLDAPNPPSARRLFDEQLDRSRMPYLEQKIFQNLAAYIYRQGFRDGSYKAVMLPASNGPEPIRDGDPGNSG